MSIWYKIPFVGWVLCMTRHFPQHYLTACESREELGIIISKDKCWCKICERCR